MKKEYLKYVMEIELLADEDVITASGGDKIDSTTDLGEDPFEEVGETI